MADLEKLKEVFGETLPEAHIFFATTANTELPSYQAIRKHFKASSAVPNRFLWKMLVEAYGASEPEPSEPFKFDTNLPADLNLADGDTINLSVLVSGGELPYSYLWSKAGTPIPGATASTFEKTGATSADNGSYSVKVTDGAGTQLISTECAVVVAPPAEG